MFVLQGLEIIDPEANFCTPGFGTGLLWNQCANPRAWNPYILKPLFVPQGVELINPETIVYTPEVGTNRPWDQWLYSSAWNS
jgi:hypothetical protein